MDYRKEILNNLKRFTLIMLGSLFISLNMITFVKAGDIIPGGFTGLVVLIQRISLELGGPNLPFSALYYVFNSIPVIICFRYVGKKFTLYSVLAVITCGFLIDWLPIVLPENFLEYFHLQNVLLSAVFGGILMAFGSCLCLYANATGGGTDLIAIFVSERYHRDAWYYIFAGNCILLAIAGYFFNLEMVLYSIIFQYATTIGMTAFHKAYQQKTLLIITKKPDAISAMIYKLTGHGSTSFDGYGSFEKTKKVMLYSVITANQEKTLIPQIRKLDSDAFINVLKTDQLNGKFYIPPKD